MLNDNSEPNTNIKATPPITGKTYDSDEFVKDIHNMVHNTLTALVNEEQGLPQSDSGYGQQTNGYGGLNPLPGNAPDMNGKGVNSANAGSFGIPDFTADGGIGKGPSGISDFVIPLIKNPDLPIPDLAIDKDNGKNTDKKAGTKQEKKDTKKEEKKQTKIVPQAAPPKDMKVIKTPVGGYLMIPADATVEVYGVKEIILPGNKTVPVDIDSAKSFAMGSDKYVPNFDKTGKFTGYCLEKDSKTAFVADPILYQDKVDDAFKNKLLQVTYDLGMDPDKLMAVMAQETGETFNPKIKNEKTIVKTEGKGKDAKKVKTKHTVAVGLTQFTQNALDQINKENKTDYTLESVLKMSSEEQLDLVEKYYNLKSLRNKSLKTIEDYALANFSPSAVGKGLDHIIYTKNTKNKKEIAKYKGNASLDVNKDGNITNAEAGAAYKKKYVKK